MEDLFQRVDSPLKIASDPTAQGKKVRHVRPDTIQEFSLIEISLI